ncbi:MAG: ABC transporter ATP-binding protein [Acidimicrobiia bacterium]
MSKPVMAGAGVAVDYGQSRALAEIEVTVEAGELLAVLGPSGSGKTTLLHAIAGFIPLAAGSISIGGRLMSGPEVMVPPEQRNVGVVFQHHALWPHLSAIETVAFPLQQDGSGPAVLTEAAEILDRLGISHLADRLPADMSGGEQQRVSLARALARHPDLFLFDEPTAHLDVPLRAALLEEIDRQRRHEGAAGLYATHDAAEALALADRLLLLRDGLVVQSGTPVEIYDRPVDLWAARLTGPASLLPPGLEAALEARGIEFSGEAGGAALIRPEWASLGGPLSGVVDRVSYRGARTEYRLATEGDAFVVAAEGPPRLRPGDETGWDVERAHRVSPR